MNIPLLDLKAQLEPIRDEIMAAITATVDSTCYIMGPQIELFEKNVADYCGTKYAVGVSSGTDALLAGLMALGVGRDDLVLTTPYTFFATMGSILRLGAQPVFVDIDPVTFNIDPAQVATLLSDSSLAGKLKAILPVHLFGQCADMAPLLKMAGELNIPVVEDAAQAIGAAYPMPADGALQWQKAGSMGACGCFSFFPSKNLGGMGDGGMVVADTEQMAKDLRLIRVHGDIGKYQHAVVGGNFRLDAMQAAILNVKLQYLPKWHAARRQNATLYNALFKEAGLVEAGYVATPRAVYQDAAAAEKGVDYHIYNQYVLRVKDRDALRDYLLQQSIGVAVYYPIPLHKQKCIAGLAASRLSLPESEKAAAETLALPIYPELTSEMQEYVVERIRAFYKK
ncbi:MAG: DegT/DnrJ/EryC1/StrS family aminotransferase [Desulfobulbaceae bacterium]|nr:DegT/DnrJ/EryC1/StrS family aminotransferase [Desulfobulbaceae bacterium]